MPTTLRVLIPESWPDIPECHWALIDTAGVMQQQGSGDPRHWPVADRTEAILSGAQASWLTVKVPKANAREQARSLPFALEDLLVREPDSQHITPTYKGDEAWSVFVLSRDRLKRLTAQFQALRRPLDAAYCAIQTLAVEGSNWTVGIDDNGVWVRTEQHAGFCDDLPHGDDPPALLQTAMDHARLSSAAPTEIHVVATADTALPLAAWSARLGVPIQTHGAWAWYRAELGAANLLHGEFSPRHRATAWKRQLRPVLIAAAVLLVLDLAFRIGDVVVRRYEHAQLREEMQRIVKTQLPGTPILDPIAQLQRELNQQRAARGLLADSDALSLLADLAVALGAQAEGAVQHIRYDRNGLIVTLTAGQIDSAGLIQRLSSRGVRAQTRDGNPNQLNLRRASV